MPWEARMCPHCHHDSFHARSDGERWQLLCGGCRAILIDNQPPLPEPPSRPQPTLKPI